DPAARAGNWRLVVVPWLSRRAQPPASVMQQLDRDERVVSFADVEGGVVVATPRGLWWPFPGGMRRIGWERVDKAVWDDSRLTVIEADLIDDLLLVDRPPISARVVTPRDLPPTVRKRVESSVVRSERGVAVLLSDWHRPAPFDSADGQTQSELSA